MDKKELQALIKQGESFNLEFKESASDNFGKEMCAFANANGGKILIGVSDDGKIKGITDSNRIRSQIQNIAHSLNPHFNVEIDVVDKVFVVKVAEGKDQPYSFKGQYFIRHGSNSQQLDREGIREFFEYVGFTPFDEKPNKNFNFENDLDVYKLKRFLEKAHISKPLSKKKEILDNLSLMKSGFVKHAGVLLFCHRITKFFFSATISCVLYQDKTKYKILDKKEYDADLYSNYENALLYLKAHLNTEYIIKGGPREEKLELPEESLREAILNAVGHRDYSLQSSILIEIFSDRVEITNPGGLVKGLTRKDLGKKSLSRNNLLFGLMQRMGLVEKVGSGIARIKKGMKDYTLKPPVFDINDNWFTVVFKRQKRFILGKSKLGENGLVDRLVDRLVENQRKILEIIRENPYVSKRELAEEIGISTTAIDKNISKLKELGLLKRVGPDKGGYWKILENH